MPATRLSPPLDVQKAAGAASTSRARPPETLKPQGGQTDASTRAASLVDAKALGSAQQQGRSEGNDAPPAGNPGADLDTSGKKVRADFTEVGSTGLQQYGGHVYEEFLRALQGQQGIKTLREMSDNDPVIGGMLFGIEMLARRVDWHLEPAYVAPPEPPAPGPPPMPVVGPGAQLPILTEQGRQKREQSASEQEHARQMATQSQVAQIGQSSIQAGGPGKRDQKSPMRKSAYGYEFGAYESSGSDHLDEMREKIRKALGEPIIGSDDQVHQAEEAAAFVESCFLDMSFSWEDTLSSILSFIPYGWSLHELIYKRRMGPDQTDGSKRSKFDDNRVGWRKVMLRSQDSKLRWEFDPDSDSLRGMWQLAPGHEMKFLKIEKCLLFRTTAAKGNPEGRSALRNAFRPWYFKKRIEEIEAVGLERDLAGLPVAGIPVDYLSASATPSQQATLDMVKKIVRNIKRDEQEGVVWPNAYDESGNKLFTLELLSTAGQRQFDTDKIVARYDQRIAMTMLADFILLGHENVGSKALGASKIDLFTAAIEAWLYHIADIWNTHAIPRLMKLNGMDVRMAPTLSFGSIQPVDLAALGTFLSAVSTAGMPLFPDEELDAYLRTTAGFPAKTMPDPVDMADEEL